MRTLVSRRSFLAGVPAIGTLAVSPGIGGDSPSLWMQDAGIVGHEYPRTAPEVVGALVGAAHADLAEVRRLVERQPSLARASWDWGFGDWESGLGAASHMGRRDIAEFLLQHGAHPTIFSAAMLGQLDVVKAFVTARPGIQRTPGPHGITLLAHARAGGAAAAPVVAYLTDVGDADVRPTLVPLGDAERAAIVGRYSFGPGPRDAFDVDLRNNQPGIQRPDTSRRLLMHVGAWVFFPSGVPTVKITFAKGAAGASQFTIADPDVVVTARRVPITL